MTITAPVTYDESLLTRNSTREFNSFLFIILPSGVCFEYFLIKFESWLCFTPPGAIQFTRIDGAKCVAKNFVRFITPAFETEYPGCLCEPLYRSGLADTKPVVAEKLTIVPLLLFRPYSLQTENNAVKFT